MTTLRARKSNRRDPKPATVGVGCNRFVLRPGRLITVQGVRWKWKCGKGCGVIAYSEKGQRAYAQAWEVKGCTPDVFERGQWKKTSDGMMTPAEVEAWLSSQNKADMASGNQS